ncbi:MAG: hypothetical protein JXR22_10275 [Prolixibacteraceae bacterium]|nr:hypothetical protein [Prolixibacteraceae bacterium]
MKKYIIAILISLSVTSTYAQDFFDALKFSQTEYGGTARSIAMGSAFGALGGDFVSASINPAGLGLYRSGEVSFSPTLNLNQMSAAYLGNTAVNDRYNFNFNNLSWVSAVSTGQQTGVLSFTFGIGFNRLKNFNSNINVQGFGANTTLLNYFSDYANQQANPNSFDYYYEGMAWNTWLIDEDTDPSVLEGIYYNDLTDYQPYDIYDESNNYIGIGYEAIGVKAHQQKKSIQRSGHLDEYLMALGMNINNKLFLGASMGIIDLEFREMTRYSEIDNENKSAYLKEYTLDTDLSESGMGLNFKTGIIYRPIKSLRLGIAVHTPNFYNINKEEEKYLTAYYDQEVGNDETGYNSKWEDDNEIYYSYRLETPFRLNLSGAYSLGDVALISVDYELLNYANSKFRASGDNYDYSDQNNDINKTLNSTGNLRIGAEYRLHTNFSLRAGYNLMGNPWKESYQYNDGTDAAILNRTDSYSSYSAGFGYRQQNFFLDFAYRMSQLETAHKVHELWYTNPSNGSNIANLSERNNQATITFGFRF